MLTSSVILDVLLLAIFAACVSLGWKRRLFRTLAELVSWLAALLGAAAAANAFTPVVMERLRPVLEGQVSQAIGDYLQSLVDETGYEGLFGGLLESLTRGGAVDGMADAAVEILSEAVLRNLAYALLFLVSFVAIALLLKLAVGLVDRVLKLPLLRQVNAAGGILAGALKGLLLALLVLWLGETTGLLATPQAMEASVVAPILLKLLPA